MCHLCEKARVYIVAIIPNSPTLLEADLPYIKNEECLLVLSWEYVMWSRPLIANLSLFAIDGSGEVVYSFNVLFCKIKNMYKIFNNICWSAHQIQLSERQC